MVGLLATLVLALGPLFSGADAPPLATLASARGASDYHWGTLAVVHADGRWSARGQTGRLTAAELEALKADIAAIPAEPEVLRATCRARPFAHLRLETAGGAWTESTPCGRQWHPAVADVAARLMRLGQGDVLVRFEEARRQSGAWTTRVVVFQDGRWEGRGGKGKLDRAALDDLRDAVARTELRLAPDTIMCAAIPNMRYRMLAGARSVLWESPCGSEPVESVFVLQRLLGDLTGAE